MFAAVLRMRLPRTRFYSKVGRATLHTLTRLVPVPPRLGAFLSATLVFLFYNNNKNTNQSYVLACFGVFRHAGVWPLLQLPHRQTHETSLTLQRVSAYIWTWRTSRVLQGCRSVRLAIIIIMTIIITVEDFCDLWIF